MPISLSIQDLGLIDYQSAWEKQRELQSALIAGSEIESFLFCEHKPVITYGSSSDLSEVLLASQEELTARDTQLIKSDRGGNITFHGPGQLICYVIIDLKKRRKDVSWYLRSLEQAIIDLLAAYQIEALTIPSQTGVWTSNSNKICSIGVRISRWCTMHGLALNLSRTCEKGFNQIIPCGIASANAISFESIKGQIPDKIELLERLAQLFIKRFYTDFQLSCAISKTAPAREQTSATAGNSRVLSELNE